MILNRSRYFGAEPIAQGVADQIRQTTLHRGTPQDDRDAFRHMQGKMGVLAARIRGDFGQKIRDIGGKGWLCLLAAGESEIGTQHLFHLINISRQIFGVGGRAHKLNLQAHAGQRSP